jgi:hypothetical protein
VADRYPAVAKPRPSPTFCETGIDPKPSLPEPTLLPPTDDVIALTASAIPLKFLFIPAESLSSIWNNLASLTTSAVISLLESPESKIGVDGVSLPKILF